MSQSCACGLFFGKTNKPMTKTPVSGFPRALLLLAAMHKRVLESRLVTKLLSLEPLWDFAWVWVRGSHPKSLSVISEWDNQIYLIMYERLVAGETAVLVRKPNTKSLYRTSWKGSNFHLEEITKLMFQELTLRRGFGTNSRHFSFVISPWYKFDPCRHLCCQI